MERTTNSLPRLEQISVSNGGVPKLPVPEARVTVQGVSGDRQRSLQYHGGPDRAVCLYSLEIIEALNQEGHGVKPGSCGENLTLSGIDWRTVRPGVRIRIGDVHMEIVSYTEPCKQNAQWFVKNNFMRISEDRHPGWSRVYARVLVEGVVRPGDAVVLENPSAAVPE